MSPSCCPPTVPMTRRHASLHRVPAGRVPRLHRYYQALRLPAGHPAPLRCLRSAVPPVRHGSCLPRDADATSRGQEVFGCGASPCRPFGWRRQGLPRSWGALRTSALLSDPGGTATPGRLSVSTRPPRCPRRGRPHWVFRGSITRLRYSLSTLRDAGYPHAAQDSLPAAGHALPGGLCSPRGSNERFRLCFLHRVLLSPASWRKDSYQLLTSPPAPPPSRDGHQGAGRAPAGQTDRPGDHRLTRG